MLKPFLAIAVGAALFAAGLAFAAQQKDTYKVTANLKARFEVPKPQGVKVGATGLFTGQGGRVGERPRAAHVAPDVLEADRPGDRRPTSIPARSGRPGPVMVALCGPCSNGQGGTATISHRQLRAIELGRTYVNVHTVKNAGGEIRGQMKASETAGGDDGGTSSQPTETTTTTTPYP
jgi:hypothetical protein